MNSAAHPAVRLVTTFERVLLLQAWEAHMPVSQLSMGVISESFPELIKIGNSIDGFRHATLGSDNMFIKVVMHPIEKLHQTGLCQILV